MRTDLHRSVTVGIYSLLMALSEEVEGKLRLFMQQSSFAREGLVITDLDGTAVHEFQGRIMILIGIFPTYSLVLFLIT